MVIAGTMAGMSGSMDDETVMAGATSGETAIENIAFRATVNR